MTENKLTAYLAPLGFEGLLIKELRDVVQVYERLILAKGEPQTAHWCQNIWHNPQNIHVESIQDAAKSLREIQRNWSLYPFRNHRRCELIQQKLPHVSAKPLEFLAKVPESPLGSWTMLDEKTLLAASMCSSPVPNGEWVFAEDKVNPPSRAYLKLWEFFTRFKVFPGKHDICLDLGASPGGWTFVLAKLAKKVIAYDRSPLADSVMESGRVEFRKGNAFNVNLNDHPDASWVFSDIICYPDKLLDFVKKCLSDAPNKNYVFTIKLQGGDNAKAIQGFSVLPGQLVHLSQNKHELTWFKVNSLL